MTITRIASSLTFLLSLSMAVVAGEDYDLNAGAPVPSKEVSYVNTKGNMVTYGEKEYMEDLEKHLNDWKKFYTDEYERSLPTPLDIRFREFVGNSLASTAATFVVGCLSNFSGMAFLGGLFSFAIIQSLSEVFVVRQPLPEFTYSMARKDLRTYVRAELAHRGFLTSQGEFPVSKGLWLYESHMDDITNPSTVTQ